MSMVWSSPLVDLMPIRRNAILLNPLVEENAVHPRRNVKLRMTTAQAACSAQEMPTTHKRRGRCHTSWGEQDQRVSMVVSLKIGGCVDLCWRMIALERALER